MRDIEFRGMHENGILYYGDLTHNDKGECVIRDNDGLHFVVKKETIGQYTGLKDKEGVKIFEGDIIDTMDGSPNLLVGCGKDLTEWFLYENGYDYVDDFNSSWAGDACTVIGNIHQNPELMEATE